MKSFKKDKPKRNKPLIANLIIFVCISFLVVSLATTLCFKLVEKDKKDNLSDEQSQVTLAPNEAESEVSTEGVGEEESESKEEPTEIPTEESKLPPSIGNTANGTCFLTIILLRRILISLILLKASKAIHTTCICLNKKRKTTQLRAVL